MQQRLNALSLRGDSRNGKNAYTCLLGGMETSRYHPAGKCKYFCMQTIDVTPSVEMLRACFSNESPFIVHFKGGIAIHAKLGTTGILGWKLTRCKREQETSWIEIAFELKEDRWVLLTESSEPIVEGMAIGIWKYQKPEDDTEIYLAHFLTVYGGKIADITKVERS